MKKVHTLITIISLLLNIGLVYFFVFKGNTVKSEDGRTAVIMSPANKNFVLNNMRHFLEGVQEINQGINENDPSKVIAAGEKYGGSPVDEAPKGLVKSLPIDFKKIAFATHSTFDEIKDSAATNFNPKQTRKQLDGLLNKCIKCHSNFKIQTPLKKEAKK